MGTGAKGVVSLLAPFEFRRAHLADNESPRPRSYYEAIPAPGKHGSQNRLCFCAVMLAKAGRAPSDTPSPPPPKRTPFQASSPASPGTHAPSPRTPDPALEQLRLELNVLRQQLALRDCTPTEDGFLLDRLNGFEQRLAALEARMEKKSQVSVAADDNLVERLVQALAPSLLERLQNKMDDCLGERLHGLLNARVNTLFEENQVDEHFNQLFKDMVDERVDALLEDGVDGRIKQIQDVFSFKDEMGFLVKDELADAIEKHLPDVVTEQLPVVVADTPGAADISVHVSRPG